LMKGPRIEVIKLRQQEASSHAHILLID